MDATKSTGPDGVPAVLIKQMIDFFAPKLTLLFVRSYNESNVPKLLKTAHITPLHKSSDRTLPNNYRPISITPIIAKIFESIVKDHIEAHLTKYHIISNLQHGFCKGKSTSTNLLEYWNTMTHLSEKSLSITVIYTDLKKAFDSVPHDMLLYKLRRIGIMGRTYEWLKNFLLNRTQIVEINRKLSSPVGVESGVPQGGVLSGMLFSIFINDLPDALRTCSISLYADDAKKFSPIYDHTTIQLIQEDLNRLTAWCKQWRLNLNPNKCFQIQYNPRSQARTFIPEYFIENHKLEQRANAKDLGVTISADLKFHKHVDNICSRANQEIGRIRRSFKSRSPQFLSNMYKLYVRPHIEYAVELWNPVYAGDVQKLEKVQNKMTRLLNHGSFMAPEERNTMLGIESHENRRRRGDLIVMFNHIDNNSFFNLREPSGRRGHSKTVIVPCPRNVLRSHSFACRTCIVRPGPVFHRGRGSQNGRGWVFPIFLARQEP